jgi:hypothetical protein
MDFSTDIHKYDQYILDNDYTLICDARLCCCSIEFYRNGIYYFQKFVCKIDPLYCPKNWWCFQ